MDLSRQSLSSAIRVGIQRSAGKTLPEQVSSVLDAIDLVVELQGAALGIPQQELHSPEDGLTPPPPNPESMSPAPRIVEARPEREIPRESIIVLPDEGMVDAAIQQHRENGQLRIRSLSLGKNRTRVSLQAVMEWAAKAFPMTIRIIPNGVDMEVELERKLYNIPFSGDGRTNERESTIKVTYHHPKLDSTMEVGLPIRVGDVQEQWPDYVGMLEQIKAQARELYKKRPQRIEGAMPTGPSLEQAHRIASNELVQRQKGKAPGPGVSVTLADADHPVT